MSDESRLCIPRHREPLAFFCRSPFETWSACFSRIARQAGRSPFTTCREDTASDMRDAWLLSGESTMASFVGRVS